MSLVPDGKSDKITFFKTRLDAWGLHASEIGTSEEAVDDLQEKVEAARQAFIEQGRAYDTAQSATLKLNMALEAMATAGATIISQVRTRASVAGEEVLNLALIPPRAKPSPIAAPGKPHGLVAELEALGTLALRWKCDNPAGSVGTMYHVSRQLGGRGAFEFIGQSGKKRFVDETIPAGTASAVYQIQAFRSTRAGSLARFPVNLGVSGPLPKSILPKAAA